MRGAAINWCLCTAFAFATVVAGCRGGDGDGGVVCPTPTIDAEPQAIEQGANETTVFVAFVEPDTDNERNVVTTLHAESGTFADPSARVTTYRCAHDFAGRIPLCVDARYAPSDDCLETDCVTVSCPERKNVCPVVSNLTATPSVIPDGQSTALIEVSAEDPDDGPEPLVTTLTATHGSFDDPNASDKTTYTCDPGVGGTIEICVVASDGDESCDDQRCTTVDCPGPHPDNICPIIEDLTATPMTIPRDERQSIVRVEAYDPDAVNPEPLVTRLSATTGVFGDVTSTETLYTCGAPGAADICVVASDGDTICDRMRCITVQCPSTIPVNLCPSLYILNAIPSVIPGGQDTTMIEVRARDLDDKLFPLVTTLRASRGSFDDVSAEDAVYTCAGPGEAEICADTTDGGCMKTACISVLCPEE